MVMDWIQMRSKMIVALALAVTVLSACDQASMMGKMAKSEDATIALNYINQIRAGKYDLVEKNLDASVKPPNVHELLVAMGGQFPTQEPISVKLVGAQVSDFSMNGKTSSSTNFTYEYEFPDRWLLANVATQKKDGGITIVGLHVTPTADSLESINRFTLSGKSVVQYSTLLFAILVPLFILYALVKCARTKIERRKWIWILFILFGIGQFAINWTTGQWSVKLLQLQLFGAGTFAPLFGPWTVFVSLPVGAIIFLLQRKKLMKAPIETVPGEPVGG